MLKKINLVVFFVIFISIQSFGQSFILEQLNQVRPKLDLIDELAYKLSDLGNITASRYLFGKVMAIQELFINAYEYQINTADSQNLKNIISNIRNNYINDYNLRMEMFNLLKSLDPQGAQHVLAGYNDAKKILDSGKWEGLEDYKEYERRVNKK